MKLEDLFTRLSLGALSGLAIGGEGSGTIPEQSHGKLVFIINEGLVMLFSKYNLLEKEVIIQTKVPFTHYYLRKEFAQSDETQVPFKYIRDSSNNRFKGDVVKILQVIDEYGNELRLNDEEDSYSVFTPQYDCLQITANQAGEYYSVMYQARHPVLCKEDLCVDILIPYMMEKVLTDYVASSVFGQMNGPEHTAKSQEYLMMYSAVLAEIDAKDIAVTSRSATNVKLEQRGFV